MKPRIAEQKPKAPVKRPALKPFSHIIYDPKTLEEQANLLPRLWRGPYPSADVKKYKEKAMKKRLFNQEGVESIQKRRKLLESLQVRQSKRRRKQLKRIKREFGFEEDQQKQTNTPTGGFLASAEAALPEEELKEETTPDGELPHSNLTLEDMVRLEEGSEAEDEAETVQVDSEEEAELEIDGVQTEGANTLKPVIEEDP